MGCGAGGTKPCTAGCVHAQYKFYAYVRPQNLAPGCSCDCIMDAINADGAPCYQGSCSEVYPEKAFDDTGWRPTERLPVARNLGETSLMLLVHPTLEAKEMNKTCEVLAQVLTEAANNS